MKIKITLLSATLILLSACASPARKGADTKLTSLGALPESTYDEKVQGQGLEAVNGSCPQGESWQTSVWKEIMPLANACAKAKNWTQVEKMGNFLAIHAETTPWGPYYLALSAEGRGDHPRAIWMLELALKKDPSEGLFHFELGRINWDQHQDGEALAQFKQASESNPSLYEAHVLMGQMAMQRQDSSSAQKFFAKALESDSKNMSALLGLATLSVGNKDWSRAEGYLNQAVAVDSHSTKARLALAQIQEEHLKKLQDALASYKTLRQLNAEKKLDESVHINLDEKIQVLEKNLAQLSKSGSMTGRSPSGEKQVAQ